MPRRVRGRVEVRAEAINSQTFALDGQGRHWWRPIAALAPRVAVAMDAPGAELARGGLFRPERRRRAARARLFPLDLVARRRRRGARRSSTTPNRGAARRCRWRCDFDAPRRFRAARPPPPQAALPPTRWRLPRDDPRPTTGAPPSSASFEDTPFYARGLVAHASSASGSSRCTRACPSTASPIRSSALMLPFRMPRL